MNNSDREMWAERLLALSPEPLVRHQINAWLLKDFTAMRDVYQDPRI